MANTYTLGYTLPDRAKFAPGVAVEEAEYQRLLDCTNLATAWVGTGCAFQQTWEADDVEMPEGENYGAFELPEDPLRYCARWHVVAPTDAHVILRIWVRVEGRGRVTFVGANDNEIDLTIDAGDPAGDGVDFIEVGDLDINGWTPIWMAVEGGLEDGAGAFSVVQVVGEVVALDSPLPTSIITGYDDGIITPFDPATATAGGAGRRPLPAARGHQLASTIRTLMNGGQPRLAWSGVFWGDGDPDPELHYSEIGHGSYRPDDTTLFVEYYDDIWQRWVAAAGDAVAVVAPGVSLTPVRPRAGTPDTGVTILAYREIERRDGSYHAWVPQEADSRWGRLNRASTWQTWLEALERIIGLGIRRTTHHACDYAALSDATPPLIINPIVPTAFEQTIRTLHRPSPGTTNLWVGFRFQAGEASAPNQSITVRVQELDGDVIDAGIGFDYRQMPAGVDELGNGTITYPARFVHSGVRRDPTAGAVATGPRLLNVSGYAGELIEIVTETTDARIIDVIIYDMPVGV